MAFANLFSVIIAIQATVPMLHKGVQHDLPCTREMGVVCKLLDDEKEEESSDDSDIFLPEQPESPGYTPESSSSSSEFHSSPQKAVKRPLKRLVGIKQCKSTLNNHNERIA